MASAVPSKALPRSKTGATVRSSVNRAPAPATITSDEASATHHVMHNWDEAEDSDFVYPDCAAPPQNYESIRDLILVCCHGIFLPDASSSSFPLHSPRHEANWLLASFQRSNPETGKLGEHETFLAHVKAGLDGLCASQPPSSILVLSGAATKIPQTPLSEARSYYHAALAEELAEGHLNGGRAHQMFAKGYILLEEQATDSFQNLLFSILLFRRTAGRYPRRIRILTHAFKAKRFLELHAPAIQWPQERVHIQGIDPIMSRADLTETMNGEEQNGLALWRDDPFGTGEILSRKRKLRGWNPSKAVEMGEGLEHSIKELLQGRVPMQLPWASAEYSTTSETLVL